jgi:starvation-inducible DNA-binding protein
MLQVVGFTVEHGRQEAQHQETVALARRKAVVVINDMLGHTLALGLQARRLRWHAIGQSHATLREMLGHMVKDLDTYSDRVAQRAVQLGDMADGHIDAGGHHGASSQHGMGEHHPFVTAALGLLTVAVTSAAAMARQGMRAVATLGDPVSESVVEEVVSGLDKWAWCLEVHLQGLTE